MDAKGWDKRYAEGRQWSVEPNQFFAEMVDALTTADGATVEGATAPGTAIDLACGEGRNAVWLAQRGWSVTAVDFSAVGVERGRNGAAELGVDLDWVVADLADYELGHQAWDLVTHVYLHWPTELRLPFLQRCADAVAPGGHFVLVGHDRSNISDGWGGPQDPDALTTPDELAELLAGAGLDPVRCELVERHLTVASPDNPDETMSVTAIDHVALARR